MSQLDPLQLLQQYEQHFQQLDTQPASVTGGCEPKVVVFKAGGKTFSLPVASPVYLLQQPSKLRALPKCKPWVMGLFAHGDDLYPVIHFASLMAGKKADHLIAHQSDNKLMLWRDKNRPYGFVVEELIAVTQVDAHDELPEQIEPLQWDKLFAADDLVDLVK